MSFWDVLWFIIITYVFFAYLMIMFRVVVDLFRDPEVSGVGKALWLIGLIFLPFLVLVIYLIARGDGMARRAAADMQQARAQQEAYIKEVAGSSGSATDQIAQGKELLDTGAISEQEYASLKAKALA